MKKLILILLLIMVLNTIASASYISFQSRVRTKVDGKVLKVLMEAINKGDESAHEVQVELRVGKKKILAEKRQELGVNSIYKAAAEFKLDFKQPGQYPLIVVLHYADANLYPFSALSCLGFAYQAQEGPSEVFGQIQPISFWKEGELKLILKNMGISDLSMGTYLVTPRELTVEKGPFEVELAALAKEELKFPVKNFSALNGSNYQVFAITEYEKEGIHHTTITPGMIRIVDRKTILGIDYLYLIIALLVLAVFFVAIQFGLPRFKK